MSNMTYTQEQIDAAIEALEIYANVDNGLLSPVLSPGSDEAPIVVSLVSSAWVHTQARGDTHMDATEAACRLRDGLLPYTTEWSALDEPVENPCAADSE